MNLVGLAGEAETPFWELKPTAPVRFDTRLNLIGYLFGGLYRAVFLKEITRELLIVTNLWDDARTGKPFENMSFLEFSGLPELLLKQSHKISEPRHIVPFEATCERIIPLINEAAQCWSFEQEVKAKLMSVLEVTQVLQSYKRVELSTDFKLQELALVDEAMLLLDKSSLSHGDLSHFLTMGDSIKNLCAELQVHEEVVANFDRTLVELEVGVITP